MNLIDVPRAERYGAFHFPNMQYVAMSSHLGELPPGSLGRVLGFDSGNPAFRKKLLSLGLTKGTAFEVVRVAPLGDPVEIRVRGASLSLRRGEAALVQVDATQADAASQP